MAKRKRKSIGTIQVNRNDDPEMLYKDKFNTPLNEDEQIEFDQWVKQESKRQDRDILMDKGTYDVQGFWKFDRSLDNRGHGSDKWKKPNHPKFSNESIYSDNSDIKPGKWVGNAFIASQGTKDLYGDHLYNYFKSNEEEFLVDELTNNRKILTKSDNTMPRGLRYLTKRNDGGLLGTGRPTEYHGRGTRTGVVRRSQVNALRENPSNIPDLRNNVSDAAWRDVLNAFEENANLNGIEMRDVTGAGGEGDRIAQEFYTNPSAAPQRRGVGSSIQQMSIPNISPIIDTPISEPQMSNKVNGYNYKKGREYNAIEKFSRRKRKGADGLNMTGDLYDADGNLIMKGSNVPLGDEVQASLNKVDEFEGASNVADAYFPMQEPFDDNGNLINKVDTPVATNKGGSGFGNFLAKNANVIQSLGSTALNLLNASDQPTTQAPVLATNRRTPYKSVLPALERANAANLSASFENTEDRGGGTLAKNTALSTTLNANTKGAIADQQGRMQFEQAGDRLDAGVNLQNARTQNNVTAMNMSRRRERIVDMSQAINAGTQDLINIDSNNQLQNVQSKELVLEALKSGDTEVLDRVAQSLGISVEELMRTLGDPRATFN